MILIVICVDLNCVIVCNQLTCIFYLMYSKTKEEIAVLAGNISADFRPFSKITSQRISSSREERKHIKKKFKIGLGQTLCTNTLKQLQNSGRIIIFLRFWIREIRVYVILLSLSNALTTTLLNKRKCDLRSSTSEKK